MTFQSTLFDAQEQKSTDTDALGFIEKYARRMRGQSFSSEHVTKAAAVVGIEFQDQRAWGAVFTLAARLGYIRRSDVLFSREFGNGSLAPGWVGV